MNAGILKHRISIQISTNAQGTYGEPTPTWVDFITCSASIEPINGREYFSSQQVNSEVTHRIKMRYKAGINSKMRVKYHNRYFDIKSVINIKEQNREIHLMAVENNG
jgi:SPP1 family predicted phage head-tail adaptor